MELVIEVRQVVFERPVADFVCGAVRVAVVVVAVAIALVQPLLIVTLELVVEDDAIDTRAALQQAFGFLQIRVLQFALSLDAVIEGLSVG